jgi:hypothetical protein
MDTYIYWLLLTCSRLYVDSYCLLRAKSFMCCTSSNNAWLLDTEKRLYHNDRFRNRQLHYWNRTALLCYYGFSSRSELYLSVRIRKLKEKWFIYHHEKPSKHELVGSTCTSLYGLYKSAQTGAQRQRMCKSIWNFVLYCVTSNGKILILVLMQLRYFKMM